MTKDEYYEMKGKLNYRNKPTSGQKAYAKAISRDLCIEGPDYESYEDVEKFITENKQKAYAFTELQKAKYTFLKEREIFTEEFEELILDKSMVNIIYFLFDNDEIKYVGKSKGSSRVVQSVKTRVKEARINHVAIYKCPSESDMHILETACISILKPVLNRDSKSKDISKLFTLPIDINSLKKVKIFINMENYEYHKSQILINRNISIDLFEKMVLVSGKQEEEVLNGLSNSEYSFDWLVRKASKV